MDIWGKSLLCPVSKFYFSLLEFLEPITVRLNQYLSSVTLSRFCWWSQLEIKRSQQSERRTPLRLSKGVVSDPHDFSWDLDELRDKKEKRENMKKTTEHREIVFKITTTFIPQIKALCSECGRLHRSLEGCLKFKAWLMLVKL